MCSNEGASVCHSVTKSRILVLDRLGAAGVVNDGQIGIHFAGGETQKPPPVISSHVESEGFRYVTLFPSMETDQRFVQTSGVVVGKSFSP